MEEREALKQTVEGLADIDKIIEGVQERLRSEDARASLADLLRLLELRRELAQEQPRPVTVRWIDEWQQTPAYEE